MTNDHKQAIDVFDCNGGKFIVVWRRGNVEECRRNVFVNPKDHLGIRAGRVFHKDANLKILNEVEKPPPQKKGEGIFGYQCSWCGKQIFWGTPEDPTNLKDRADKHRLECPKRPGAKRKPQSRKAAVPLPRGERIKESTLTSAPFSPVPIESPAARPPPIIESPPPAACPQKFKVIMDELPVPKGETEVRPGRTFKKFIPIAS